MSTPILRNVHTTIWNGKFTGRVHMAHFDFDPIKLPEAASGVALCGYANSERTVFTITTDHVTCKTCQRLAVRHAAG